MIDETSRDEKPLITFALFSYNQEKYIREAVEGALSQTYSPLEIVISDDCSRDRTFEIIKKLTREYTGPHKLIINQNAKNVGLATHVNKIFIELSTGEWVVSAAGDDIFLPDRVENIWTAISQNPTAKGVNCAVRRVDEAGAFLSNILPREINIKNIENETMHGAAAAYHRDVFDFFGPMDSRVQNEDNVLSLRALLLGDILSVNDISVLWRRHSNNLSGRINLSFLEQIRFQYGAFIDMMIFAKIQQFKDLLFIAEKTGAEKVEYQELQLKLLKKIQKDWKISMFSRWLFDKVPVPYSIKFNPLLWWFFFMKITKSFIAKKLYAYYPFKKQ